MTVLWIAIAALTLLNAYNWLTLTRLERRLDRMVTVWAPTGPSFVEPHASLTDVPPRYPTSWDGANGD